jgi:hypothetical protein
MNDTKQKQGRGRPKGAISFEMVSIDELKELGIEQVQVGRLWIADKRAPKETPAPKAPPAVVQEKVDAPNPFDAPASELVPFVVHR